MKSSSLYHIDEEIQYAPYKIVIIMILMTLCGVLGTFYVFSLQEKQAFIEYKEHVQQLKYKEITELQGKIQHYRDIHNAQNLQQVFPTILQQNTMELQGSIQLQEYVVSQVYHNQKIQMYVVEGDCIFTGNVVFIPILLHQLQKLGLWIYKVDILSSEQAKTILSNQNQQHHHDETSQKKDAEDKNKEDKNKEEKIKKDKKKNSKNTTVTDEYIQIYFEYPLPNWDVPNIFLKESFVSKSYDVLAFLAYWEIYQSIQHDPTLIISINDHIHQRMLQIPVSNFERHRLMTKTESLQQASTVSHIQ